MDVPTFIGDKTMNEQAIANLQFAISHFGTRCQFKLSTSEECKWTIWIYDSLLDSEDPIARVYGDCEFEYYYLED